MNNIIHYDSCPACGSETIFFVLKAKDETVSKQFFEIWQCDYCSLRFTQDVPDEKHISEYYKSDAYISHTNTHTGIINKLYHAVRDITLWSKKKLVEKSSGKTNGNLLDIGAGTGAFASAMKKTGWQVTALEPDETARQTAKRDFDVDLLPSKNLFSLPADSFDAITLWHVLEHVHQLHLYLDTFYALLKEKGSLIIAVPNYTTYDAKTYAENWAAYDVPRHLYHFSPKSMKILLGRHGFVLSACKPMWFDSFYVSLLSEKYKSGKNRFLHAFSKGAASNLKAMQFTESCSSIIYVAKK